MRPLFYICLITALFRLVLYHLLLISQEIFSLKQQIFYLKPIKNYSKR